MPNLFEEEIQKVVPPDIITLLDPDVRDGARQLVEQLPQRFRPRTIARATNKMRAWELCGLALMKQTRVHDALMVFNALYEQCLKAQQAIGSHMHKGMPLVWISECHLALGHPVLSKRYLMLTACEDAIRGHGFISPGGTGVYFRLVWRHGMSDQQLRQYAISAYKKFKAHRVDARFPEWLLQELDQDWMIELPSFGESLTYCINRSYATSLLQKLGSGTGKELERLAHYLLSSIPGCRAARGLRTKSTEYDIVCSISGPGVDFRAELGRYFICECKDWTRPVDFSALAKFSRVLESAKCRFGILFAKEGITGTGRTTDAERELLKVFQDRGLVIVAISRSDLAGVASGENLIAMLRSKYEQVRFDLRM